jgi:Flp pilus assembly protein TadD
MTGHLIQSTVAALIAVGAVLVLKRQRAALRHSILLAAMLRFVVPTPWLVRAGEKLAGCMPSHVLSLPVVDDVSRMLRPKNLPVQQRRDESMSIAGAAGWLWSAGTALMLGFWMRRQTRRVEEVREANAAEMEAFGRALRNGNLWTPSVVAVAGKPRTSVLGVAGPSLRIISAGLPPGACGLLRPTILLPEGLMEELTEAEVDTVLAHELAHLERKDLWAAATARIVTCVFWFHPLLWWMEGRMLRERESACDELVLARGATASDYAGAIAKVCRLVWHGSQAYAGIGDSNLTQRMEHIMRSSFKSGNRRTANLLKALLGGMTAAAMLLPVAGGFVQAQPSAVSGNAADALYQACLGNLKTGQNKAAEEGFRRLHEIEPNNPRSVIGIATVYLHEGREGEAIRMVESEVRADPSMVDAGLALGDFYIDANMYTKAVDEFKQILGSAGDSQTAERIYARMGEAYRRAGDLNQAMWALRQASEQNPNDPAPVLGLALILEGTGEREAARQEYVRVLDLEPKNAIALNNLAYIEAVGGGDLAQASEYAQRARVALPQSNDVADTVGWIYVKRQMGDEAVAVLKDVVLADPGNMDFRKHLASAMDLKGLNSASMEELKKALRSEGTSGEMIVGAVRGLR